MRIQVQIQDTLIRQYSHHPSVKNVISQLDSELMDITKVTHSISTMRIGSEGFYKWLCSSDDATDEDIVFYTE